MFLFKIFLLILFSSYLGTALSKNFPNWTGNLSYSIEVHLHDSNMVLFLNVTNKEDNQHKYRYLSINDLSFNYYSPIEGLKPGYLTFRLGNNTLSCSETEYNLLGGDYLPSSTYNWKYEYGDDELDMWSAMLDYGDCDKRIYFQFIADAKTRYPILFQSAPGHPLFGPSLSTFTVSYLAFSRNVLLDNSYFPPIPDNCANSVSEPGFIPFHITALMNTLQGIFKPVQLALSISQKNVDPEFSSFLYTNRKFYKDEHEYFYRYEVFKLNRKLIEDHNQNGSKLYKLGITKFADMKYEEINMNYSYITPKESNEIVVHESDYELEQTSTESAESIDLAATISSIPVKDQVFYGNSWAFSIISALDISWYINTNEKVSFSEQQIIDCSCINSKYSYSYCGGSDKLTDALNWITSRKSGLVLSNKYPYSAIPGECKNFGDYVEGIKLINVLPEEKEMISVLNNHGPILASMDSTGKDIIHYKYGVYDNFNCKNPSEQYNHKILIVGYGKESINGDTIPYWLIKNSWGRNWGIDGYMKVACMNHHNFICGFHLDMSFIEFDSLESRSK